MSYHGEWSSTRAQGDLQREPCVGVVQRVTEQLAEPAHAVAHRLRVDSELIRDRRLGASVSQPRPQLALAGALAVQGSPGDWVANHRKHHAHTDEEGDPHSPHAGYGSGVRGAMRGLWHAHVGWLWTTQGAADARKYAPELVEDPFMRWLHRHYHVVALATFALPAALGLALTGTWLGALTGLLWGGFIRVAWIHHVTWSINSVCHFFGRRRFALEDHSTNVAWLALPSLGEAWHHNHHAFARSAFHGLRGWEAALDPTGWVIRAMRRLGLAWNVIEITPERQAGVTSAAPVPS